ncbi:MAG: DUF222 domain-containing protein [Nocardioides sp.]|uniref:HNH endonuclease signature motif containing protein n=1 Tax=Nocardioides sp. TaxID=35761 RepID=UPI0039E33EE9
MVVSYADPTHPILRAASLMREVLGDVAGVDPMYMTPIDQGTALRELTAVLAQVTELRARIMTTASMAGGAADAAGAHTAGAWLATETRIGHQAARAEQRLADGLVARPAVAAGMRAGTVAPEQARVILTALDSLPESVETEMITAAEAHLVDAAARHTPRELRLLGRRVLDVLAPDVAEAHEARALEAEERTAREKTSLWFAKVGDGTTRFGGRLPDVAATRLATYLHALLNPRRATTPAWARGTESTDCAAGTDSASSAGATDHLANETAGDMASGPGDETVWWRLPGRRKLGHAFCELLERIDPDALPDHGGASTELVVTMTLDALRADLATASIVGPNGSQPISASEARRLACGAGIIPAVLGGAGQVLDLGRTRRLATRTQRTALALRHPTCQGEHCDRPAAWCEVHHLDPWAYGGRTDLDRLVLLCSADHHLIHDTAYLHERLPDGTIRFTRRT